MLCDLKIYISGDGMEIWGMIIMIAIVMAKMAMKTTIVSVVAAW